MLHVFTFNCLVCLMTVLVINASLLSSNVHDFLLPLIHSIFVHLFIPSVWLQSCLPDAVPSRNKRRALSSIHVCDPIIIKLMRQLSHLGQGSHSGYKSRLIHIQKKNLIIFALGVNGANLSE